MESAIMTSSGSRLKKSTRLRAASLLARNSKSRQNNKNHPPLNNHKNNRIGSARASNSARTNNINVRHLNYINKGLDQDNNYVNNNGDDDATVSSMYKGKLSRQVYSAICLRLGPTPHIPGESVQALFNDMQLFPSKTQVSQMLQIARQCGNRNGGPQILTFGEFLVFFREMQKSEHRKTQQTPKQMKCTSKCEVFLGGSCNPTTWRTDIAIPELKKHGITFYNPQVSIWAPELVAQEHEAKQSASVLLFVVDSQTRSTGGMIEVAYLVAAGRCVVLVVHPYRSGQSIMGEPISQSEYTDLVEAQTTLLMLVKSRGVRVHNNLTSALQCTANILRNTSVSNGLPAEELVTQKLKKLREVFDSYDANGAGKLPLNSVQEAYYRLTNRSLKISELYTYLSASKASDPSSMRISFEQFCALVAEFSADGHEMCTPDERVSQPLQRQRSTNNNSNTDTTSPSQQESSTSDFDIYLGGSCHTSSTWREDIAIPLVKKHGLTYYNPTLREPDEDQQSDSDSGTESPTHLNGSADLSAEGLRALEGRVLGWKRTLDRSKVLLFVITNDTRSLTTMVLAAHYIASGANVVLCGQQLPVEDCRIGDEKLTKQAIKDYTRGRVYLTDLARRKQVPVFENVTEAVQSAISRCGA